MENKINIAELLKDCPEGMELDCVLYNKVTLLSVDDKDTIFPIKVMREDGNTFVLTKYGQYAGVDFAKCIIFPKGKTTWEGFVPLCKFKNGDVCYVKTKTLFEYIFIFRVSENHVDIGYYVTLSAYNELYTDISYVCTTDSIKEIRHATEEEKQKLFDAIKANGFKWNAETKTLEKLPRFKVGDRITCIYNNYQYDIKELTDTHYTLVEVKDKFQYTEPISEDKNWKLVSNKFDINTLKPFESRVLIRDYNDKWVPSFWGKLLEKDSNCRYLTTCGCYKYCIPYEGNEHLLGTTNDCDEYYKTWE